MRVLVATSDRSIGPALVKAYAERGWDVVTGAENVHHQAASFDLLHLHWPEELIGWGEPTAPALDRLARMLEWWRARARILVTVHNLAPHRSPPHPLDKRLYELVYNAADLIGHFSRTSLERVGEAFPETASKRNLVHTPHLFPDLLSHDPGRAEARRRLELKDDDLGVLVFGALRHPAELRLVQEALQRVKNRRMRVIFAAQMPHGGRLERRLRRLGYEIWRRRIGAIDLEGFAPDESVAPLCRAADLFVIPRLADQLNSGLMSLAMTTGTPLVAPRCGAFVEYLEGAGNFLYAPGSAPELAKAIDAAATADLASVARTNVEIALGWGWPRILDACLPSAMERAPPTSCQAVTPAT